MQNKQTIASFYLFFPFKHFRESAEKIQEEGEILSLKGTVLVAKEGLNATISGQQEAIDQFLSFLSQLDPNLSELEPKYSYISEQARPFYRFKVKIKKEIVTLDVGHLPVDQKTGQYILPEQWDQFIHQEDVILIDTRNDYEYVVGTFQGAVNPHTKSFKEFPAYVAENLKKDQKIAMFCTGGIRCTKASSYLLEKGFKHVYQLQGGVLNYLARIPKEKSSFQGECFVFDNRVSVDQNLEHGSYQMCHACRHAITEEDQKSPYYQQGVSCPYCFNQLSEQQKKRFSEREKQVQLAKKRNQVHIGARQGQGNKKTKIYQTQLFQEDQYAR